MRVDVKDFGALGDPLKLSKDAEPIQKAIEKVNAAGGGIVFVPAGIYRLEKSISVYSNITLQGEGMNLTKICSHKDLGHKIGDKTLILIKGESDMARVKNIQIAGITFSNNEDGRPLM